MFNYNIKCLPNDVPNLTVCCNHDLHFKQIIFLPDDLALIVTVPSNKRNNVLCNILDNLDVGCLGQTPTKSK